MWFLRPFQTDPEKTYRFLCLQILLNQILFFSHFIFFVLRSSFAEENFLFETRIECWWIYEWGHWMFQFFYKVLWNIWYERMLLLLCCFFQINRNGGIFVISIDLFNYMFSKATYWNNEANETKRSGWLLRVERKKQKQHFRCFCITKHARVYIFSSITRWHLIQIFFIKIRNNMNKFDYADVMPILG